MIQLDYIRLTDQNDQAIADIKAVFDMPQVARFISYDKDNYFSYVTETEGVFFYKVYHNGALAATTHIEQADQTLYMGVVVFPQHRQKGIATQIVKDVQSGTLPFAYGQIEVSIDRANIASIKLFENAGFVLDSTDMELQNYIYKRNP